MAKSVAELQYRIATLLNGEQPGADKAKRFLIEHEVDSVPVLCDMLYTSSIKDQWKILRLLTELKDPRSVPALMFCLGISNSAIVSAAAQLLGTIGNEDCLVGLMDALDKFDDTDTQILSALLMALGELGDNQAVDRIITVLHRTSSNVVRYTAISSLGKIGDTQVIEDITHYLEHENHHVRNYAKQAIREIEMVESKTTSVPL